MIALKIFGFTILSLFVLSLGWRLFSNHGSAPCPSWLSWLIERDNPLWKIHRSDRIIENADIQPGMVVLDAGCGPGRITLPAAKKVGPKGQVVAMDIQKEMLSKTQKKIETEKLTNVQFFLAGLPEKNLEQNKYDRILLVTVLGEIPDRKGTFKKLFDALKSGGILSITEMISDPHFQSSKTILQLAKEVGFEEQKRFGNRFAFTLN